MLHHLCLVKMLQLCLVKDILFHIADSFKLKKKVKHE